MTTELTGRCSRCGEVATQAWTSRDSVSPLELCDLHATEHADAVKKGSWVPV